MGTAHSLSEREKERIYQGKLQGQSIAEIARTLGCSVEAVRKWWRRIRDEGVQGIQERPCGRPRRGALSTFSSEVREEALKLKRSHPGWGADRVSIELVAQQRFDDAPSRSRLSACFKEQCPECLVKYAPRAKPAPAPPKASAVHEIWELDSQEKIVLANGEIATICNIRDPFGAAMIGSQAFSVKTEKHWRKLTLAEIRQVLRTAFAEWQTLPDAVQTDNELVLAGTALDPFPSKLTLWLVGLGIQHNFIRPHRPTDQPEIERNHRTLDGLALHEAALVNLPTLQQSLDHERHLYNACFPSRASDCERQQPLLVHPQLLQPRRPYRPEQEWQLFSLQRVYDFLTHFQPFERKVSTTGQVSLGRRMYTIDRTLSKKTVWVTFDAQKVEWVFQVKVQIKDEPERFEPIARRNPMGLDYQTLTGSEKPVETNPQPIQLSFPLPVPGTRGTH